MEFKKQFCFQRGKSKMPCAWGQHRTKVRGHRMLTQSCPGRPWQYLWGNLRREKMTCVLAKPLFYPSCFRFRKNLKSKKDVPLPKKQSWVKSLRVLYMSTGCWLACPDIQYKMSRSNMCVCQGTGDRPWATFRRAPSSCCSIARLPLLQTSEDETLEAVCPQRVLRFTSAYRALAVFQPQYLCHHISFPSPAGKQLLSSLFTDEV